MINYKFKFNRCNKRNKKIKIKIKFYKIKFQNIKTLLKNKKNQ